jgi:hypothetical protein
VFTVNGTISARFRVCPNAVKRWERLTLVDSVGLAYAITDSPPR